MKNKTGYPYRKYGDRICELMKEKQETATSMIEFLCYANEKSLPPFRTGKKKLSEDQLERLAERWNVRKEYLNCEDDFKTDADLEKYVHENDLEAFRECRKYLETLGLRFSPCALESTVLMDFLLHGNYYKLEPYLSDDTKNRLSHYDADRDFDLGIIQFEKKHGKKSSAQSVTLKWKCNPSEIGFDDIGLTSGTVDTYQEKCKIPTRFDPNLYTSFGYEVYYKVVYKGKEIMLISVKDTQDFFQQVRNFSECVINSLLINGTHYGKEITDASKPTTITFR